MVTPRVKGMIKIANTKKEKTVFKGTIEELEDFIKNPKKYNNVITLSGYAGTGKSTLIGIFDKYLQTKFITPNYSAPTHRANAVT